ncbi:uncharacterized protein BX664DRAFT_336509 [Halteromyces radiatus]|uniref:uncharacterized protein n=1 Tax=Halteromyces radiatus TaxID=101107 RepID=UPI00221E930B|nr:uncharacterized protein BX664DRAFT_336509 [Halteromyces radiatus]KAI8086687.1 hypothetical protein BX664DRAFT_336509 [Halteromyces radiatus]
MKLSNVLGTGSLSTSISESSTSKRSISGGASYNTRPPSRMIKPLELALPDIPSLNLSFFDDDSTELANLTKSLGVNLSTTTTTTKPLPSPGNIGTNKLNRASDLLKSSLEHLPESTTSNNDTIISTDNIDHLRQKLKATTELLISTESNFEKLKSASQKALDEFTKAKEEFAKEMLTRQQHEYTILQLRQQLAEQQSSSSSSLSLSNTTVKDGTSSVVEKEIDRLAGMKVELEQSCNKLKEYRDTLASQIDQKVQEAQAGLESSVLEQHQLALQEQIRSLISERDALKMETQELNKTRDEVIHEMVILNTKNAELSSMNNDLSRRMTEREREAAAIMAGTSFIHHAPSPSPSTELLASSPVSMQRKSSETSIMMQRMTSRDSSNSKEGSSKMFKMKKPKTNVFNKITSYGFSNGSANHLNKKDNDAAHALYGAHENHSLYNLNTSSSVNMLSDMKRKGSKQSCDGTVSPGSHSFIPTSFLRPVKCMGCGEKIWGATEYRCQGCGSISHMKCISHLPSLCYATSSSLELVSSPTDSESSKPVSMFGTSLVCRVAIEERDIPLLVEQCIEAVEARGMDYEGIYRKSGGAAQMRAIQLAFESNEPLDLKDEDEINDICAVTSVLKQYFRELPDPLLTYQLYDHFMEAVRMPSGDNKNDKFIELISQLPKANYDTMKLLMNHLNNVRKQSETNLMTTKNLAMVFGPTLLRDKDASRDLVDMSYKNATIEYIINHTQLLFAD